jgi:hypothetical protein
MAILNSIDVFLELTKNTLELSATSSIDVLLEVAKPYPEKTALNFIQCSSSLRNCRREMCLKLCSCALRVRQNDQRPALLNLIQRSGLFRPIWIALWLYTSHLLYTTDSSYCYKVVQRLPVWLYTKCTYIPALRFTSPLMGASISYIFAFRIQQHY